ncbi:HAD family hydrolase [Phenylobacterium montanum]|uniref:HAD family phosphatase n=1 Tax=Phenylobacterium montanum TaxID=2823693 RepID=A0A975G3Q2_9CAUL|nr:HAD family phosphatase [Caulobacter sp. S6]QUD90007.1 HAD family phosphatase [Caulobacter sp. S6]
MAFPRPVQAVVFDMDGLLIDSEGLVREGILMAARNLGFEMPVSVCAAMIGLPMERGKAVIRDHFGPGFDMESYVAEEQRVIAGLFQEGVALKAGVVEILDQLDILALPRAVATSSGRGSVNANLGFNEILHRFHAIVSREDVSRHKPHPDPFLKAAAHLGVEPHACLALEDSHNGVRAAHAAGMMTVMVPDLLDPTEEMHAKCVHIAESLHEVTRLLALQAGAAP